MKDKILKYNAQVPRYTSYPTAPHFKETSPESYGASLQHLIAGQDISLYIHVPFCKEMCWYCGCHTTATKKYAPVEDYISLLLREIKILCDTAGKRLTVKHLHFGGGSPSMLSPDDFLRIMSTLHDCMDFAPDAEIALEADPRGITHDRVSAYAQGGVNRASFGLQDFSPDVQAAINRVQSLDTAKKATDLFRIFGITSLNFDLMYGLPKQKLSDVEDSVDKALSLEPNRIALFGYAHVPWMKKHMRLIKDEDLPDASLRLDQFSRAEQLLNQRGMTTVGLDHFVKNDDSMLAALQSHTLSRNFQGYTTDDADTMLGLGVSSIGRTAEGFFQNYPNITEYSGAVLNKKLPVYRGRLIDDEDRLRAHIISDLMCYLSADIGGILIEYGHRPDYFDTILASLDDMCQDGLVTVDSRIINVHPSARQAVRVVAARFDAYFTTQDKKHTQAA